MTANITVDSAVYDLAALGRDAGQSNTSKLLYRNGVLFVEGVTQAVLDEALINATTPAADVEKSSAIHAIDEAAGRIRAKFLTVTNGQSMIYIKKEMDAEAFKAANYPEADIMNYPWIQTESNVQGDTGRQVTDAILYKRDLWVLFGTKIEEERLRGKLQVEHQLGSAGIINARDTAINALNNIGI